MMEDRPVLCAPTVPASSRLESFIRRLEAQRSSLDWAAAVIADMPGPVLELGLGNGRTYSHLRARLPGRRIFAFDRVLVAHPACVPPAAFLVLGELAVTLPAFARRGEAPAALVHADLGSSDVAATALLARWLGTALAPLLASGGLVLSDQRLEAEALASAALPAVIPAGRYFAYRRL
jgi:S-adenosyl-L-methionine methyltransferase